MRVSFVPTTEASWFGSASHTRRTNLYLVLHPLVFQLLIHLIGKRTLMRFTADRIELLQ